MKNIARNLIIIFCFTGLESSAKAVKEVDFKPESDSFSISAGEEKATFLLDFKATYNSNLTLLEWRTGQNSPVVQYFIEFSNDGVVYHPIAEVKGSSSLQNYKFSDNSHLNKDSFYRLRMVDSDGNVTYSSEVVVKVNPLNHLRLFPVPVKNTLNIKGYFGEAKNVEVSVSDLNGNKYPVYNLERISDDHYTIDFSSYYPNTYLVTISNFGKSAVYRVQKK